MSVLKSKSYLRAVNIFANSLNIFLPSITNTLTSVIVIRLLAPEWWGQITILQLYMYLGIQLCAWGNRESLLKLFSENPAASKFLWMESFSNRLFLLVPIIAGAYLIAPDLIDILYLSIWIVLRYFIQSFESIISFSRNFLSSIIAETIGLVVTVLGLVIFRETLSYHQVLFVMTVGFLIKTIVLTVKYRSYFSLSHSLKPDFRKLKPFLPFMLIGFSGVLQQKADMISVAWFSSKIEIAQYQVFSSLLLFAQSISGLLIGPYVKNIYRLPKSSYVKIQQYFLGLGVIISITTTTAIYLAIEMIYHFDFSFTLYLLGFMNSLLTYSFILKIFIMYKNNKQKQVMMINGATVLLNFVCCFLFINELKLQGAILANVVTQIVIYLSYKYYLRINLSIKL